MIDFGLSKGQLELAGMVCAAALVAIPFLKWALGGIRRQVGHLSISTVVVLSLCTVHSLIVGGTKTNGVNSLPPQQMMQGGFSQTGFTGLTGLSGELFHGPSSSNLVNLVNPVQNSLAERMARNWNIRGAFDDSLWLDFEDGFVFPEGTNHFEGVEVLASGEVWRTPFDTNAVATIGAAVSIVPGLSSFAYEHTPSNSYRFVWTDAAINRDTNNLVTAALELFRNGDWCVTTNGTARWGHRALPFPHDGFGQDDEWVAANFTNATEILAMGYSQWVDAQVGEGLTNGLYKFTATIPDDPLETTCITVGALSVAVTNAGEYVFLLGKGIYYPLSVYPENATNIVYAAVDDVQMLRSAPLPQLRGGSSGCWSTDSGTLEMSVPVFPLLPGSESAHIVWTPTLGVSPGTWQPGPLDCTRTFTAVLADAPWFMPSPSFAWSSVGEAPVSIGEPVSESTVMTCTFPAAYGKNVQMLLDVEVGPIHLQSVFSELVENFDEGDSESEYLGDVGPSLLVDASPLVVFFEKGVGNTTSAGFACRYNVESAGTFTLGMSDGECMVRDSEWNLVQNGYTWRIEGAGSGAKHFSVYSPECSSSPSGTVFTVTFTPDEGNGTMTGSASVTFVEWETETVETWPADRRRKELGVGERVFIAFDPKVNFDSTAGTIPSGSVARSGSGKYRYTAPTNACLDAACFYTASGCVCAVPFSVLEPSGNLVVNITSNVVNQMNVAGDFDIVFDLVLMPTNVSFNGRVQIVEVGMAATNATGYFAAPSRAGMLNHGQHGANVWVDVGVHNSSGTDTASPGSLLPPFSEGSFTWPIPNHWRMKGAAGSGKWFCNDDQHFAITSNGTSSVWKFGKKGVRILNSNILTITDEAIP